MLRSEGDRIRCELERSHLAALGAAPELEPLADFLVGLCKRHDARLLLIDGPQAWKDEANGLRCQRVCEKALATPGKTGVPEVVLPRTWTRFAKLSIALFDALACRGLPRSAGAFESFPTASWRALGERPLPGKNARKRRLDEEVRARARVLAERFGVEFSADPGHDELQAAVAGLAGIALEGHRSLACELHGVPPYPLYGSWREGVIVVPVPANSSR